MLPLFARVPEPIEVFFREWVWWTLLNGFSVSLALPGVLLFLILMLFFRFGAGIGLPRLFWHAERLPQFLVGIGVGAVLWQTFLAGYLFEEFATNFTVDRPPFCEVREPYEAGKGLPGGEYPGRFRLAPASVVSIWAYAGVVAGSVFALTILGTVIVLAIQFVGQLLRSQISGWRPHVRKQRFPHINYTIWLPLGAVAGWLLMTAATATVFALPTKTVAEPIGKKLIHFAGWGMAAERRDKVEQHVADCKKADNQTAAAIQSTEPVETPESARDRVRNWFTPYLPVYAAFVLNFALIAVVSIVAISLPAQLRVFTPAVGIVLLLNIVVFGTILLAVFPPLAVSGNFFLAVLFGFVVLAGRAYKFHFPNMPSDRVPLALDQRYAELIAAESNITDEKSAETAVAQIYAGNGVGPTVSPVFSHKIPYPPAAARSVEKPPLAIVSLSGGGSRAAAWAMQVLTTLEDRFQRPGQGRRPVGLPYHTRLVTGASGGMLAGAYYVASLAAPGANGEVTRNSVRRQNGGESTLSHADLLDAMRQDLLTPITHTLVNHDLLALFAPLRFNYDRGQALEEALRTACHGQLHVPFSAMRDGEAAGWRPSLIFSPMLVEDGRQLLISNLDLRLTTQNRAFILGEDQRRSPNDPEGYGLLSREGVEFFKLFPNATDFTLATAARMSATFPYVLPAVMLPTNPPRRVVDAGYYDNFGIGIAASWIFNHMKWIEENTSGVVVIQIRDGLSEAGRKMEAVTDSFPTLIERGLHWLTTPPIGLWNSRNAANSFQNDNLLHLLEDTFLARGCPRGFFSTVAFEFPKGEDVAMSFTLSSDEVQSIEAAVQQEQFNARVEALLKWWHTRTAAPQEDMSLREIDLR